MIHCKARSGETSRNETTKVYLSIFILKRQLVAYDFSRNIPLQSHAVLQIKGLARILLQNQAILFLLQLMLDPLAPIFHR